MSSAYKLLGSEFLCCQTMLLHCVLPQLRPESLRLQPSEYSGVCVPLRGPIIVSSRFFPPFFFLILYCPPSLSLPLPPSLPPTMHIPSAQLLSPHPAIALYHTHHPLAHAKGRKFFFPPAVKRKKKKGGHTTQFFLYVSFRP